MIRGEIPVKDLRLSMRMRVSRDLFNLWSAALPGASSELIKVAVQGFIAKGVSRNEMESMLEKITQMGGIEKSNLSRLVLRGLQPEQIQLFVESTPKEREILVDDWRPGLMAKMKRNAAHAPEALQTATSAGIIGGALGCLAFMSMTLMVQDASFYESGKALLGALSNPSLGLSSEGWQRPSMDRIAEAGASASLAATLLTVLVKTSGSVLAELLKPDPSRLLDRDRIELEDKIMGAFARRGQEHLPSAATSIGQSGSLKHLKDIPNAYLPVLTHLQPKELVVFLAGDDQTRESMLRVNPPGMGQQIDTVRALHSTRMGRAWHTARQSLSSWEGLFSSPRSVSLDSSLAAMRSSRSERKSSIPGRALPVRPSLG